MEKNKTDLVEFVVTVNPQGVRGKPLSLTETARLLDSVLQGDESVRNHGPRILSAKMTHGEA